MQISYHSTFTKIQKLQNWKKRKKEKKSLFLYRSIRSKLAGTQLVFKPIQNIDVSVLVHVSVQYIPQVPANTVRYQPP